MIERLETIEDKLFEEEKDDIDAYQTYVLLNWFYIHGLKDYINPIKNYPITGAEKQIPIFAYSKSGKPVAVDLRLDSENPNAKLFELERSLGKDSILISLTGKHVSQKDNRISYFIFPELEIGTNEFGFKPEGIEAYKSEGHRLRGEGDPRGTEMVAEAHFDRSRQASSGYKEHPGFDEYMKHWLHAMKSKDKDTVFDSNQIEFLTEKYGLPERPKMKPGFTYWNNDSKCYY